MKLLNESGDLCGGGGVEAVPPGTTCFGCGCPDVEVWGCTRGEDGSVRLDYWCPVCETHRHHEAL